MSETQEAYETDGSPYTDEPQAMPLEGRCNARTRGGGYCQNWPTEHGRCRMHGGGAGTGRPPSHGLYSKVLRKSLADKYAAFLSDPDYMSLTKELALARGLLSEYLSKFADGIRLSGEDIGNLGTLIERIGKLVERMSRIEARDALTMAEVRLLQATIIHLLSEFLTESQRAQFADKLSEALGSGGLVLPAPADVIIEGQFTRD